MGLRGPAAKPTELKQLEGTYRRDRAATNEPKPRIVAPHCPEWLTGEGRNEYRRIAKMLVRLRVMTEADRAALAAYAREYQLWREADEYVERNGSLEVGKTGALYMSPMVGVANMHFKNMTKLMIEFGLTPASRTRIEAQPPDDAETTMAEKLFASVGL